VSDNQKITNIEMEMALDEIKEKLHYIIQLNDYNARVLKAKYDSLVDEGFNENQALEIIKTRPINE